MPAIHEVTVDVADRVIVARLAGLFTEAEMNAVAASYREATEALRGKRHMVIADMRGMKPLRQRCAEILGEVIRYGRENGTVLCVHLSDHVVQRLQASRLARENSPTDDITVDVQTPEEARRVVEELRPRLDDPRYGHSIRDPVAGSRPGS